MPVFNCRRSIKTTLFVIALAALASPVVAQDKQDRKDDIGTIRLNTDLVSVDVIVTDRAGNRSAADLKVSDFAVYEDGVRQKISSFSATDVPFNLVLLIDTSGSTRDEIGLMRPPRAGSWTSFDRRIASPSFNSTGRSSCWKT